MRPGAQECGHDQLVAMSVGIAGHLKARTTCIGIRQLMTAVDLEQRRWMATTDAVHYI